jgi:putative phosphoribosyl transferase
LADALEGHRGSDVVVLGLPRGGVPVAFEVARSLGAPLDVLCVRKLGVPFQPELAAGAVGEDGVLVVNPDVLAAADISPIELDALARRGREELEQKVRRWRGLGRRLPLAGRTALVVDDGIATGATARAACQVAREHGAARVVLAAPVGSTSAISALRQGSTGPDEVVCLDRPPGFYAVGQAYRHFDQTTDEQVTALLRRAADPGPHQRDEVEVPITRPVLGAGRPLAGVLDLPPDAVGLIAFAHGSGSSRLSPRNRQVAEVLGSAGLGTLLLDLLTEEEATSELERQLVFDIGFLADRLAGACRWLRTQPGCERLPLGLFGASTGAAAALTAARDPMLRVDAVVSRGGRPDLAEELARVHVPTLLVVGGRDTEVLRLNRLAQRELPDASLVVVPGATHLFEEPGTLERVALLARDWFLGHLAPHGHGTAAG